MMVSKTAGMLAECGGSLIRYQKQRSDGNFLEDMLRKMSVNAQADEIMASL